MVFQEYFRRPNDTKATFDREGWFRTGDIVVAEEAQCADESAVRLIHWPQPGQLVYRILGRNSTDIIKVGQCISHYIVLIMYVLLYV